MIKKLLMKWLGVSDYEQVKQENVELYHKAHYDDLTGLANRLKYNCQATKILATCIALGEPVTVILVDLDNFKMINDSHGHQAGNVVLQEIAKRLNGLVKSRCVLATDVGRYQHHISPDHPCDCFAARLGGDEFVLVFEHMDRHEADIAGQSLVQELKEPVLINGIEVSASASVGISIYPWDGDDIHTLLKAADLAMYAAKESGKDRHMFYERSMNTKVERRVEAELAVRDMITKNNLVVYYQPIIETDTGEIVGAEALLRGKMATDKFFNPLELITAAEDTNLIIPLGALILKTACRFARRCIDMFGDDCDMAVSVNVSAHQLTDPGFSCLVERTLHECDLTPDHLVLEITETMLMQNFNESERTLAKLRNIGIRISIDDFGKGYSSFSYLQRLPIDKIKIDISFVQSLGIDNKANEIVKGIILMADALGMHTCAEGVETELQYKKLLEYGCEQVQGYYNHRALSEQDFVDVLVGKKV
jgi:predicted signal transduction protein with EAL and GGDEF domain